MTVIVQVKCASKATDACPMFLLLCYSQLLMLMLTLLLHLSPIENGRVVYKFSNPIRCCNNNKFPIYIGYFPISDSHIQSHYRLT